MEGRTAGNCGQCPWPLPADAASISLCLSRGGEAVPEASGVGFAVCTALPGSGLSLWCLCPTWSRYTDGPQRGRACCGGHGSCDLTQQWWPQSNNGLCCVVLLLGAHRESSEGRCRAALVSTAAGNIPAGGLSVPPLCSVWRGGPEAEVCLKNRMVKL